MAGSKHTLAIFLLGLLFMDFSLSGRPARAGTDPIEIVVGTLGAGNGRIWIQRQVDSFNLAQDRIRASSFSVRTPPRDNVRIEDLPELAANVLGVRSDLGYEIAYLVSHDLLVPIDDFLPDPEFDPTIFHDHYWQAASYQGKRWGIPYLASAIVLVCDWPLFKREGIEAPPRTWEEFEETARRLTKDADGDGAIDQWGFRIGLRGRTNPETYYQIRQLPFYLWVTRVLQEGGFFMKDGRFDLSHPSLEAAFRDVHNLLNDPGIVGRDDRRFPQIAADSSALYGMQFSVGDYQLRPLVMRDRYRVATLPSSGAPVIADERRQFLVVAKSSKEKEKASWEFLKWISRGDIDPATRPSDWQTNCRTDLMETEEVRQRISEWAVGFETVQESKNRLKDFAEPVMGRVPAIQRLGDLFMEAFEGRKPFDRFLRQAESECNRILSSAKVAADPNALYLPADPHGAEDGVDSVRRADLQTLADYDDQLKISFRKHPQLALEECEENIEKAGPFTPVALYRRASYYRGEGDFKRASLDYLRFYSLYPERAKRMGLIRLLVSCLKQAGLYLEAEALITAHEPELYVEWFSGELATPENGDASPFSREYFENAPSLERLKIIKDSKEEQTAEFAIFLTRLACAAARSGERDLAIELYADSIPIARKILENRQERVAPPLALAFAACADNLFRTLADGVIVQKVVKPYELDSPSDRRMVHDYLKVVLDLGIRTGEEDRRNLPISSNSLSVVTGLYSQLSDFSQMESAMKRFSSVFPREEEGLQARLDLASLLRDRVGSRKEAIDQFDRVLEASPESRFAVKAAIEKGEILCGLGDFEKAHAAFQNGLETTRAERERILLESWCVLCEWKLGREGEAEDRMKKLLETSSTEPYLSEIQTWLIAQKIARHDYASAESLLKNSARRPPQDSIEEGYAEILRDIGGPLGFD